MKRLSGLVIVLAACGGSDRVDDFVGTWTYQAGASSMIDCDNNQFDLSGPLTGSFQIARGTSSDLIGVPDADDTCPPVRLDVDGDRATAQAGQMCVEKVGTAPNTITVTAAVGAYTLTLDGAGTTITLDARGSAMFSGAATATCTATAAGSATKTGASVAAEPGVKWLDSIVHRLR